MTTALSPETPAHMSKYEATRHFQRLFAEHNLSGWTLKFGSAKRQAGLCNHRDMVITMSAYLMAQRSHAATLMTITHEVAHAIVGPSHGHDYVWARQHRALGGDGRRCFQHDDEQAPYLAECRHGTKARRYKRVDPSRKFRLRGCGCVVSFVKVR